MLVGFCKKMKMQGIDPRSLGKPSHALPFELYPPLIYVCMYVCMYVYIIPHIHYKGHRVKKERIIKGHCA